MKKYFIAFFLFCLSLFLINDVYAEDRFTLSGYNSLINASLWNCSGSNTCSASLPTQTQTYDGDYLFYTSGQDVTIGSNGIFWALQSPVNFSSNYLYSVNALVCYNSKANNTFQFLTGESGNLDAFEYGSYSKVYNNWAPNSYTYTLPWSNTFLSITLSSCRSVTGFINPSKNGNFLGLRLKNSGGTIGAQRVSVFGLKVESLGVDSSSLRSVLESSISSSGLAKASDVNEVKKAQEQIKTELKNTQQSIDKQTEQQNKNHKETMDAITSEDAPDSSQYGNVAGWLPAGTIDSLVNLPLSMLTSINNSATKTCTPYNLPFINNTTISMPCIGNYLENLNGFGTVISSIDLLMSVFLLYKLLMSLYKDIQKHLDLKNTDSDLGGIE